MPDRDLYRLLGVSAGAAPAEIRRAYRRIVFDVHPDVGKRPDPKRFREVHEAYEVLSDPDRRRSYDLEMSGLRRPLSAEALRARTPIAVLDQFLTVRPFVEELLHHIGRNFLSNLPDRGGPPRRLVVEAILEEEEARFGCRVPFELPSYIRCPRCEGTGEWWGICTGCDGRGVVESTRELMLEIPPGTRDGERFEVTLREIGIGNLLLDVQVSVTRCCRIARSQSGL
jgi:molecular chaperone DnaJ